MITNRKNYKIVNYFFQTKEELKKRNGLRKTKATRSVEPIEVLNRQSIPTSVIKILYQLCVYLKICTFFQISVQYDLRSAVPGCVTNIKNQGYV